MRLFVILIMLCSWCQGWAAESDDWQSALVAPRAFAPIPRAGDAYWRDSIPLDMRDSYIRYGEQYLGKPWQMLPFSVFAEFKTTGNRVNYEALSFEKRRQLAALVMAEVMEGKGRFLSDIINGLGSFCEETWWGLPAHYGKKIPLSHDQNVDLFNAETASLIVWTTYMLRSQLDAFTSDLARRIDGEISRRILEPALKEKYWWKTAGMNWNPWICSNWLACVLLCEADRGRQVAAVEQIVAAMHAFMDAYHDDGGCDEGPGYWDRAAASLFDELELLRLATGGRFDWSNNPKLRAMGSYVYNTYIGHDYCVNFADSHDNKTLQQVNVVYPFGLYLNDRTMREFAAYLGERKGILADPAPLYDKSGNFPTLGRELFFLRHVNEFALEQPREPQLRDVWLPDLQIMTARRGEFFVAMKGGTNGENHNHNDVGSFVVYADNEPLLIDVGVGEYTSKTFSGDRYSIWTMQSQYHNLPQINGVDQKDGKQYASRLVSHKDGMLCLDIAGAYPPEAAVKSWRRTVTVGKSTVRITEDYELSAFKAPSRLMFMTPVKPVVEKGGAIITLGKYRLKYDARALSAEVEDISELLDPLLRRVWGDRMYRIVLTVKKETQKGRVEVVVISN